MCCSASGPTFDGRIKPDVCGPGTSVTSAESHTRCDLSDKQGTSMATPVVAGVTALIRQYFVEGWYPNGMKNAADAFVPMGALLKAVLVNSGRRLTGKEASRQVGTSFNIVIFYATHNTHLVMINILFRVFLRFRIWIKVSVQLRQTRPL